MGSDIFRRHADACEANEKAMHALTCSVERFARVQADKRVVNGVKIAAAEDQYDAKYVGLYSVPEAGEGPFLVFWRPQLSADEIAKGFDNYFGLWRHPLDDEDVRILSAKGIRNAEFAAIEVAPGQYLCSRSVHDNVSHPSGAWLDGGPYYTRCSPDHSPTHVMRVVDGEEVFTPIPKRASEQPAAVVAPAVAQHPMLEPNTLFDDLPLVEVTDAEYTYEPTILLRSEPEALDAQFVELPMLGRHDPAKEVTRYANQPPTDKELLLFLQRRYLKAGTNGISAIMHDVGTFHIAMGQPVRYRPQWPVEQESKWRDDFLIEEYREYREALEARDLVKLADAFLDMIYVICGTAHFFGLALDDGWDEVHSSNMAKRDPRTGRVEKFPSGKVKKPEGWEPPNIAMALGLEPS